MAAERLQKVLANRGVASRREAEAWIRAGRVRVNGRVVTEMGVRVDPDRDAIETDGRPLPAAPRRLVLVLNKPEGYVTTVRDPHADRTVMDLVGDAPGRVYPVGRLDRETKGVLLFTNDGDLAHRLLHPSRGVDKVYEVVAAGRLGPAAVDRLKRGVDLDDGRTAPARVWAVRREAGRTRFRIALHEGRKRQVRRMVGEVGGRVLDLTRVAFGPVEAAGLAEGAWRPLRPAELAALERAAGLRSAPARRRRGRGGRR